MKEVKKKSKKNLFKRFFIKLCRLIGYEIIDQSNFYIPTLNKSMNENLKYVCHWDVEKNHLNVVFANNKIEVYH